MEWESGGRVQCVQCHKHPNNRWAQQNFWEMNAFFQQAHVIRDKQTKVSQLVNRANPISVPVKTNSQVKRLLWAVALMGVLVGGYSWAQFYGHDVFNLREIPGGLLLGSTMGNSILAGAVLLMTITVSLAAATLASILTSSQCVAKP